MSAEAGAAGWLVSLDCTRGEAEAIDCETGILSSISPPPVVSASEVAGNDADPGDAPRWRLDLYFEDRPDAALVAALRALVSATAIPLAAMPIADEDWVAASQAGLAPVRVGRFIIHTPAHPVVVPRGARALTIDAGRAFGTGHHATTTGCLAMIDDLASAGRRFADILDLGTGTGLLAFAACGLWPAARVTATDLDPVAIEVAIANARSNQVALGEAPGALALVVADGTEHGSIAARAPYDLVIANILAAPLVALAPAIARITAPGGAVVLAGLLSGQAAALLDAWLTVGFKAGERRDVEGWTILRLARG